MDPCAPWLENTFGEIAYVADSLDASRDYYGKVSYDYTNDRLVKYVGPDPAELLPGNFVILAEPAKAYTPVLSNVTLGTGSSLDANFHRQNGFCEINGRFILGTGGATTGPPSVSLPLDEDGIFIYASNATATEARIHSLMMWDNSATTLFPGWTNVDGGDDTATGYAFNAAAAGSMNLLSMAAGTPMTWALSDRYQFGIRYRMENPRSF